jgi:hypothetical protein
LAIVFEIAIRRRRSRAVGWRRAMMVERSRSISTSVWLTRSSVASTSEAISALKLTSAWTARATCDSTMPAHLEHAGGDSAQLGVELRGEMAIVHGISFSRSGP